MARYPLLAALIERRSRRFGHHMNLNGGPLAYDSASAPLPLTLEEEAVLAFVDYKYAPETGAFRDGGAATSWKDGSGVQAGIPPYSDRAIAATIAYCEYVYERYGRFPANRGPFRTVLAHQAHHLDRSFYDRFYRPGTLTETQRQHLHPA